MPPVLVAAFGCCSHMPPVLVAAFGCCSHMRPVLVAAFGCCSHMRPGLENFCVSQFFPDNATIVVGKDAQFGYECDYATVRRTGRMTAAQKHQRAQLEATRFKLP